jgi:hypothetical protein
MNTHPSISDTHCPNCEGSGYTDHGEADSPDGPGRSAIVCGPCKGSGWRDGLHVSDQRASVTAVQMPTTMLSRSELAHRFEVRKARELIDWEEQQIGDASDGCGEGPGGESE